MRKKLTFIISGFIGIVILLAAFISVGLWTMDIEDRYGDLQEVYYQSHDGDLIMLKDLKNNSEKYGLIEKSWNRVFVQSGGGSNKQELSQWVNAATHDIKVSVYRGKDKSTGNLLLEKPEKIHQLISADKLELVLVIN